MGRLGSKDKIILARLKLRGADRVFYSAQPQLRVDECTYEEFRTAFVNLLKDKHTDQYHYSRMQNASQERNESPDVFLNRLRKLCQRTNRGSGNHLEEDVINQEAERRLLAAYINGLNGAPGKQVRLDARNNIEVTGVADMENLGGKSSGAETDVPGFSLRRDRHNTRGD